MKEDLLPKGRVGKCRTGKRGAILLHLVTLPQSNYIDIDTIGQVLDSYLIIIMIWLLTKLI